MTIANMINKKVVICVQSAKGTIAPTDTATAQQMRFLSFTQDQTNETYMSEEMRADKQVGDVNIGPQDGNGACSGELTPGTFELFEAAVLRKDFAAGSATAALEDLESAVTVGAAGTLTSAGGAMLSAGMKVGDVIQMSGWAADTTDATANNAHNFLITAATATVLTVLAVDGVALVAKDEPAAVTITVVGQKCWTPATSHLEEWFTIEHDYHDVDLSETFWDCKPTSMSVKAPATGIPTVDFNILGLQMTPQASGDSPYFTQVTAITSTEVVHSGKSVILVQGVEQTLATGLDFEVNGNNVVGSAVFGTNVKSGIYDKRVEVKGTVKILFEDDTIAALYRAGTEVSISAVFPVSDDADADFMAIHIPIAKLTGAQKEGDNEIAHSFAFTGIYDTTGDDGSTCTTDSLNTTLSLQDSTLS